MKAFIRFFLVTFLVGVIQSCVYADTVFFDTKDMLYIDVSKVQNYTVPLGVKIEHNGNDVYYNAFADFGDSKYLPIKLSADIAEECTVHLSGALDEKNIKPSENIGIGIGEFISLGSYNGEMLLWRFCGFDENGMLFVSDEVIKNQSFSEGTDNLWVKSDIKSYLDGEFLSVFSEEEKSLIRQINQRQNVNVNDMTILEESGEALKFSRYPEELANSRLYSYFSADKVFIPDIIQVHHIAKTTDVISDGSAWWLRTPVEYKEYSDFSYLIDKDGCVDIETVDNENIGIRPAFYLDLDTARLLSGNGSREKPYILSYVGEKVKLGVTVDKLLCTLYINVQGKERLSDCTLFAATYNSDGMLEAVSRFEVNESFNTVEFKDVYKGFNKFYLWYNNSMIPLTDEVRIINNY